MQQQSRYCNDTAVIRNTLLTRANISHASLFSYILKHFMTHFIILTHFLAHLSLPYIPLHHWSGNTLNDTHSHGTHFMAHIPGYICPWHRKHRISLQHPWHAHDLGTHSMPHMTHTHTLSITHLTLNHTMWHTFFVTWLWHIFHGRHSMPHMTLSALHGTYSITNTSWHTSHPTSCVATQIAIRLWLSRPHDSWTAGSHRLRHCSCCWGCHL